MMNNPFHKQLTILALFIFTISPQLEAQYLDIQPIGQRNSQWCWAASMEMAFQFYGKTTISQCDLAKELVDMKHKVLSFLPPPTHPVNSCNSVCDNLVPNKKYNKPIPFSKRGLKLNLQFVDMLFAKNGYHSIESIETASMDIAAIEHEIESCRPFFIFLNKFDKRAKNSPYPHVVTAKGYYNILGTDFVLVNDPQKDFSPNCKGCELLLPIDIFSASIFELNSALEVVTHIIPIDKLACDNCDEKPFVTKTELITTVENNPTLFSSINTTSFSTTDFTSLKGMLNGSTPVFVETSLFYYGFDASYNIVQKDLTGLVSNTPTPQIAFLFEEVGSTWKLKEISKADCTAFTTVIQAQPPNADSETEVITFKNGEFEVIEFLPDNYQFYRVIYKESSYLIPANEYVGLPFKAGQMYREKSVFNYLKKVERRNNSNRGSSKLDRELRKRF